MKSDRTALKLGQGSRAPARTGKSKSTVTGASTVSESKAPPFLVAAVGASAGGLEAFSSLLRVIPADTRMALVLVQHLARDQRSILPELLDNVTALHVRAARDEMKIEPQNVYVIPPDAQMTIADGHLRVRPAPPQRAREGTVDLLFRSIADEYKERAVGIVLSGSAHDGAAGLRHIKAEGGMTMAQVPEEATVDGMPRAALATGAVDTVLPVQDIGHHLVRLARHPFFTQETGVELGSPTEALGLQKVFGLLRRTTGVDFNSYKLPTLKRRIDRRMALHRLSNLDDYVAFLLHDSEEVARLQEELLIHVTSFFREPTSFQSLQMTAFPRILADRAQDGPIRFWVPGCSTGEEAYSLAITALELLGEQSASAPLQIFATDVSDATLEKARAGIYSADIVADVSPERLRRFFVKQEGDYRITKEVRDRCVFARQDITRDPPFSKLDLIVCRNLLIYLNQATQRRVLGTFHYALRPGGVLMLGRSETVGVLGDLFSVLDKKAQLYLRKGGDRSGFDVPVPALSESKWPDPSATPPAAAAIPAKVARPAVAAAHWDPQNDADRFLLDQYAPPAVLVDADHHIVRSRGSTGPFLELPSGEVSVDLLKMARPELQYALRTALREARTRGQPASSSRLRFKVEGRAREVNLQVVPLGTEQRRQYLVLFEEPARPAKAAARAPVPKATGRGPRSNTRVALEQELNETRRQLQSIIDDLGASNEKLQSANEEILSSNEELQSTNEELDTAKEELQSTNEELSTLNDELHGRNEELSGVNSDLANLLASVKIPIVMVTRGLRIRRFTPAAESVLNIIPSDVGRPIGHLKPNFVCPDLEDLIKTTIDSVTAQERQIEGTHGELFTMQIRPYQTVDNRIDGAVLVLFDISSTENQAAALELARATGEALMSTVREPILLLDGELKVLRANRNFGDTFGIVPSEIEGRFVYDLGNGQWGSSALRRLLEEVLPERRNFEGFELDLDLAPLGPRRLLLDARRIESGRRKQGVIVLVVRDVTGNVQ